MKKYKKIVILLALTLVFVGCSKKEEAVKLELKLDMIFALVEDIDEVELKITKVLEEKVINVDLSQEREVDIIEDLELMGVREEIEEYVYVKSVLNSEYPTIIDSADKEQIKEWIKENAQPELEVLHIYMTKDEAEEYLARDPEETKDPEETAVEKDILEIHIKAYLIDKMDDEEPKILETLDEKVIPIKISDKEIDINDLLWDRLEGEIEGYSLVSTIFDFVNLKTEGTLTKTQLEELKKEGKEPIIEITGYYLPAKEAQAYRDKNLAELDN